MDRTCAHELRFACVIAVALLTFTHADRPLGAIDVSDLSTTQSGRVAQLARALLNGSSHLPFREVSGYLPGLLRALHLPIESQVAVFSQTSAQSSLISPDNPRVIYFSDDIAVGWVRGSSVVEVAESNPNGGTVFYTVRQDEHRQAHLTRNDSCRSCHVSERTLNVPGLLILSTAEAYGGGASRIGTVTDHTTPLPERWGGWYVTGRSRGWRHRGNRIGQGWLSSLYDQFYDDGYLGEYSDVVALMVLEHQTRLTNLLTALAQDVNNPTSSVQTQRTVREIVDYMLFVDEASLPAPIIGTSGYTQYFSSLGPRDKKGRSLRDFNLKMRLFQYRCSYMIYSQAFDSLLPVARHAVYDRLLAVLTANLTEARYAYVSADERRAVVEILSDTKPEFDRYRQLTIAAR